jgi:hypothetical protein
MIQLRVLTDAWYEELSVNEKLVFLTCLLLPDINPAGVVEVTIRRLAGFTGLDETEVRACLEGLAPKVQFFPESRRLFILNYFEQQSQRSNVATFRTGAQRSLLGDPPDVLAAVFDRYPELRNGVEAGVPAPAPTPQRSGSSGPPPGDSTGGSEAVPTDGPGGDNPDADGEGTASSPPPKPARKRTTKKAPARKPDDQMAALLDKLADVDPKWRRLATSPSEDPQGYAKLQKLINQFSPGTVVEALQRLSEGHTRVMGDDPYPLVLVICQKIAKEA